MEKKPLPIYRLVMSIVMIVMTIFAAFGVLPGIHEYYPKLIATCFFLFIAGLIGGYQPMAADRESRRTTAMTMLSVIPMVSLSTSTQIADFRHMPAGQRDSFFIQSVFLLPFFVIIFTSAISLVLGQILFQRIHPGVTLPHIPHEETQAITPEAKRTLRNHIIVVVVWGILTSLCFWLFNDQRIMITKISSAILFSYMSFTFGYGWRKLEPTMRRFILVIACSGPVFGFIGVYLGRQNYAHLVFGIKFAIWLACILFIPAWIGIYIERRKNCTETK